ncbi:MAG: sulfatase [Opitutaceae bacterium]|nr:sulfatase [Opitutaceae bacterium]
MIGTNKPRSLARRLLVATSTAAALADAAAPLPAPLPATAPTRPPNILFCIADDQSFPHASAYGCTWVNTPAFDQVAREGLLFRRAYTPNAKCAPARANILTGRQSWQLGAAANHCPFYPPGYRTFMEALALRGYATGFTGKGWAPGDPGAGAGGKPRELTGPEFNARELAPPASGISKTDYAANFADFLARRPAARPFCFWLGAREPHRPYEAGAGRRLGGKNPDALGRLPVFWPDTGAVRDDMLDYAFEIEHWDAQLARALALLEQAGELDNTIIVVTSDNGMPFPRAKGTTYELSLHVPLAIRWPAGVTRPGRVVEDFVSFVDFAPTILEAAGLTAETAGMEPFAGRSLFPILRDTHQGKIASYRESLVFGQERHDLGRPGDAGYPVRGCIQDGLLYFRNFEPSRWPMCDPITGYLNTDGSPTKTLILVENRRGLNHWRWDLNFGRRPPEELYDFARDPDCVNNLAGDTAYAGKMRAMRALLHAELTRQQDPRLEGRGGEFDAHPYASRARGLYGRIVEKHERVPTPWAGDDDREAPGFDPERPGVR